MSRDLPANPNLDHLKKQAKAMVRTLREQRAAATLADAQHAVAREYGFASWPKLKAHVAALAEGAHDGGGDGNRGGAADGDGAPAPLFPRFTEASRRALFFSRYEAFQAGRLRIRPEHVLLGVIRAAGGATRTLFESAGITLEDGRAALIDGSEPREVLAEPVEIPFEPAVKALFTAAAEEADRSGHVHITTSHIVLAVLRGEDGAASFLRARGISIERARAAVAANPGEA
jgi:hypothetical protein